MGISPGRGVGVVLGILGWGCAIGTLEPLAYLVQLNSPQISHPLS